jgi:hypothetical protein
MTARTLLTTRATVGGQQDVLRARNVNQRIYIHGIPFDVEIIDKNDQGDSILHYPGKMQALIQQIQHAITNSVDVAGAQQTHTFRFHFERTGPAGDLTKPFQFKSFTRRELNQADFQDIQIQAVVRPHIQFLEREFTTRERVRAEAAQRGDGPSNSSDRRSAADRDADIDLTSGRGPRASGSRRRPPRRKPAARSKTLSDSELMPRQRGKPYGFDRVESGDSSEESERESDDDHAGLSLDFFE